MKKLLPILLALATGLCLTSAVAGKVLNDSLATKPFGHHIWQDVLNRYVTSAGEVDLVKLRANPKRLNQYLTQLENVSPEIAPDYFPDRNHTLAYWINAHNALALRLIVDAYPVKSLKQIPDFEQSTRYKLGNRAYSLAMLKRKIGFFNRPKALLALSDYSMNTPPVLKSPYEGPKLEAQLEEQASRMMQGVGYRTGNGGCVGILLPPAMARYGVAPFSSESEADFANSEEALDLPLDAVNRHGGSDSEKWAELLFPYAPPAVRADLRKACEHPIEVKPENQALRVMTP